MSADLDAIRQTQRLADVAWRLGVQLRRDGDEHVACCPFHEERTPSFSIFTGRDGVDRFHCFGCGEKGDVLDFVMKLHGVGLPAAIEILGGKRQVGAPQPKRKIEVRDVYAGIQPVPFTEHPFAVGKETQLFNPKRDRMGRIRPTAVYTYREANGQPWALVLRNPLPDGGKETPAVRRVKLRDGSLVWSRYPLGDGRRLYRLPEVMSADQVFLVEGEKCAEAISSLKGRTGTTFGGGGKAWRRTDFSPLAGKDVILWADADPEGCATMTEIGVAIYGIARRVRIVDPIALGLGMPKGWDCADLLEQQSADAVLAFVKEHIRPFVPPEAQQAGPSNVTPLRRADTPPPQPVVQMKPEDQTVVDLATGDERLPDDAWMGKILFTPKGKPEPKTQNNANVYTLHHKNFAGTFVLDEARDRIVVARRPFWEPQAKGWTLRELSDVDVTGAQGQLEWLELRPTRSMTKAAIQYAAQRRRINSLQDELASLRWDGKARVERFMVDYCGAVDNDYATLVSRLTLVQAVARALRQGCKADVMTILEGAQNLGKSTLVRLLAGDQWYSDQVKDIDQKDALQIMAGRWILELAEMSPARKSDADRLKAFLSTQVDEYRPPYGETPIRRPRQQVFIGTHNPDGTGYLKDPTGARRFLPIQLYRIDHKAVELDRDQLLAEAVAMFQSGVRWWLEDADMPHVVDEQKARTERDPWTGFLHTATERRVGEVQLIDLLAVLDLPKERVNAAVSNRIIRVMWSLGWDVVEGRAEVAFRRRSGR